MNIEFLSTVAVIAPDPLASRRLYVDALGLPLGGQGDGYQHSERIAGCKSFGIWPLSQAAEAFSGRFEPREYTTRDGRHGVAYELHDVVLEYGAKPRANESTPAAAERPEGAANPDDIPF